MIRVLFVCERNQPRLWRQASALHATGRYHLGLVVNEEFLQAGTLPDIFDEVHTYRRHPVFSKIPYVRRLLGTRDKPLRDLCRGLRGKWDIAHDHGMWGRNFIDRAAIGALDCPTIFDCYDITSVFVEPGKMTPRQWEDERFCFERPAGVILKAGEDYVREHYNITAPVLIFRDYCVPEAIVNEALPKLSAQDGELHLVYTGMVFPMGYPPGPYARSQYLGLARQLDDAKVHFHIYPTPFSGKLDLSAYEAFARESPYFHLHASVPPGELPREISQYDWAMQIHDPTGTTLHIEQFTYTMGNKTFTYLEAGLPQVVNDELVACAEVVREWGIGATLPIAQIGGLADLLRVQDLDAIGANVARARAELSMPVQIKRLERFYERVLAGSGT
jgi:hypothetical protein